MRRLIRDVVFLVNEGWRPYDAQPADEVYANLDCPHAGKKGRIRPFWFTRQDVFCCVGCERACTLSRPKGFPPPLPINYPSRQDPFMLTPQELVRRRHTLNVRETAYCLNISDRQVYTLIANGRLTPHKDRPVRVPATEVAAMMEDFDE